MSQWPRRGRWPVRRPLNAMPACSTSVVGRPDFDPRSRSGSPCRPALVLGAVQCLLPALLRAPGSSESPVSRADRSISVCFAAPFNFFARRPSSAPLGGKRSRCGWSVLLAGVAPLGKPLFGSSSWRISGSVISTGQQTLRRRSARRLIAQQPPRLFIARRKRHRQFSGFAVSSTRGCRQPFCRIFDFGAGGFFLARRFPFCGMPRPPFAGVRMRPSLPGEAIS